VLLQQPAQSRFCLQYLGLNGNVRIEHDSDLPTCPRQAIQERQQRRAVLWTETVDTRQANRCQAVLGYGKSFLLALGDAEWESGVLQHLRHAGRKIDFQ